MTKNDEYKQLLKVFAEKYRVKTNILYFPSWGRDFKILKDLLLTIDKDTLSRVIDLYFQTEEKIYSLPFMKVRLNDLLQKLKDIKEKKVMINPEQNRFNG